MTNDQAPTSDPERWSWPAPTPPSGTWGSSAPPPPPSGGRVIPPVPERPPRHPQPLPEARTNGLAVASLVLSLVWLGGLGALLAVIFGHVAIGQIDRSKGHERGRGMALAGTIIGWIGVVLTVIFYGMMIDAASDDLYYEYGY